jgi:hypothetical protein
MSSTIAAAAVSEEVRASLLERLRAMHELFRRAVADLTVAHVNHYERAGVLPIAFSLSHGVTSEDRSVGRLFGVPLLWDAHATKVALTGGVPFRGTAMADAERVRIADMDGWREYQRAVHARTEEIVATASLELLGRTFETQLDPSAFLAILVGPRPVRVIDAVEAWVYQHGIRHVGELEHARALVGLSGLS